MAKQETVYTPVSMKDGRTVQFAGKKQVAKAVLVDTPNGRVGIRFDFRNGHTRFWECPTTGEVSLQLIGHGGSQKIGDEFAGITEVDDMVIACDDMIGRLSRGEWSVRGTGTGDSFSGASIVIRAICEVSGKSVEAVKAFLEEKISSTAAAGQKLTRNQLYASFRNPDSRTGKVIARLEAEKAAKTGGSQESAEDLLAELG